MLIATAILFVFNLKEFNFNHLFRYQAIIQRSDLKNAIGPYPNRIGVKPAALADFGIQDKAVKINTKVIQVTDNIPRSNISLGSDSGSPYASGLQEKSDDQYLYRIYLLNSLPEGVIATDVIRYIFLNLFFDSFAADPLTKPEERRAAFQHWLGEQKNYIAIDKLIEQTRR